MSQPSRKINSAGVPTELKSHFFPWKVIVVMCCAKTFHNAACTKHSGQNNIWQVQRELADDQLSKWWQHPCLSSLAQKVEKI
jgi:hypothetical protein